MAPPNFPNGMTLRTIGYAALKYPELCPPIPVPTTNQMGALQHTPISDQNHMVTQLASQYLTSFIAYQTQPSTTESPLNNKSDPQYYFSSVLMVLNFLTRNPDVCKRIAADEQLFNGVIDRMLEDDFVERMKTVERKRLGPMPPGTFEDEFGSLLQFISTILLYRDDLSTPTHSLLPSLIPKLKAWKTEYKRSNVRTISNASERLVDQIQGMDPSMISAMREMQNQALVCGSVGCSVKGDSLTACGACKIQRYCGKEHQKADWKYHKHICDKGLVEPEA